MVHGYKLFNQIGVSTHETSAYEILSNRIGTTSKHIGDIKLKDTIRYVLTTACTKSIITMLEVIKYGFFEIEGYCNGSDFVFTVGALCKKYRDDIFKEVIERTNYSFTVLMKYVVLLNIFKPGNHAKTIITRGVPIY